MVFFPYINICEFMNVFNNISMYTPNIINVFFSLQ